MENNNVDSNLAEKFNDFEDKKESNKISYRLKGYISNFFEKTFDEKVCDEDIEKCAKIPELVNHQDLNNKNKEGIKCKTYKSDDNDGDDEDGRSVDDFEVQEDVDGDDDFWLQETLDIETLLFMKDMCIKEKKERINQINTLNDGLKLIERDIKLVVRRDKRSIETFNCKKRKRGTDKKEIKD